MNAGLPGDFRAHKIISFYFIWNHFPKSRGCNSSRTLYVIMNEQSKREKLAAKILFWSLVVPITFGVFFRIFFLLFDFVYGFLIVKIFGQDYADPVAGIALITSLGFIQ